MDEPFHHVLLVSIIAKLYAGIAFQADQCCRSLTPTLWVHMQSPRPPEYFLLRTKSLAILFFFFLPGWVSRKKYRSHSIQTWGFDFKSCPVTSVISFILIFPSCSFMGESLRSAMDILSWPELIWIGIEGIMTCKCLQQARAMEKFRHRDPLCTGGLYRSGLSVDQRNYWYYTRSLDGNVFVPYTW